MIAALLRAVLTAEPLVGLSYDIVFGLPTRNRRGRPTGLEPATFGATIRRHLFLGVVTRCRIGLSKPISLLVVADRFSVLRAG